MMDQQLFNTFMARFDKNDEKCDKILEALKTHVHDDERIHAVVAQHATYWKLLSLGVPLLLSALAVKIGWK